VDVTGKIQIVNRSDKGLKRLSNEDCVGQLSRDGVVVLADGMGGHKAGEVASAIAVDTLMHAFSSISKEIPSKLKLTSEEIASAIKQDCTMAIIECNQLICQTAASKPNYNGMGTTVVTSLFFDNKIIYSHVGDSRIYRYRENILQQLTIDHTLLQELIDHGFYTEEEAKNSLNKNLVTKALGIESEVEPSTDQADVEIGDVYLCCSDGLHDMISDTEIGSTLYDNADDLEAAAEELVSKANLNGGADNVSVVLAKIVKPYPFKTIWYEKLANWL